MFIEALGWVAAVLGAGVALPQVIRLFKTRTTAGLSAPAWQATLGANLAWLAHGFLTGHANIWLPNLCYLIITMTILSRLVVDRRLPLLTTFAPGLALGAVSIALDVWTGPVVFAVAALIPSAFTQLAQFRALVISPNVRAVSMTFLILNVVEPDPLADLGRAGRGDLDHALCATRSRFTDGDEPGLGGLRADTVSSGPGSRSSPPDGSRLELSFVTVAEQAAKARTASIVLAQATRAAKDAGLEAMADALAKAETAVLEANADDVARAEQSGTSAALIDRLRLTPDRIAGMVDGPASAGRSARSRSVTSSAAGPPPAASRSGRYACRSASSGSSTRRVPT